MNFTKNFSVDEDFLCLTSSYVLSRVNKSFAERNTETHIHTHTRVREKFTFFPSNDVRMSDDELNEVSREYFDFYDSGGFCLYVNKKNNQMINCPRIAHIGVIIKYESNR